MKLKLTAILMGCVALASAAQAQELVGEAGGWEIYRDASMGNGCYMTSEFEDGSIVQVGFDLAEDAGFMSVFNAGWTDIEDGATYPVSFDLGPETYTADSLGMNTGDLGGILVLIEEEDFLTDLALRSDLVLSNDSGEVAHLDLEGSRSAVLATIDCLGVE